MRAWAKGNEIYLRFALYGRNSTGDSVSGQPKKEFAKEAP